MANYELRPERRDPNKSLEDVYFGIWQRAIREKTPVQDLQLRSTDADQPALRAGAQELGRKYIEMLQSLPHAPDCGLSLEEQRTNHQTGMLLASALYQTLTLYGFEIRASAMPPFSEVAAKGDVEVTAGYSGESPTISIEVQIPGPEHAADAQFGVIIDNLDPAKEYRWLIAEESWVVKAQADINRALPQILDLVRAAGRKIDPSVG